MWEGEDWLKEESWPCPGLNVRQDYKGSIPLLSGICRMVIIRTHRHLEEMKKNNNNNAYQITHDSRGIC